MIYCYHSLIRISIAYSVGVLSLVPMGCDSTPSRQQTRSAFASFDDMSEQRHDFGSIIGRPFLLLHHNYPLINITNVPVRILRVQNRKPCCGEVALEPTTLQPGDSVTLDVTVRVGEAIGSISHHAVVETDYPGSESLDFWTTAYAYPRVRIERKMESIPSLVPGQEKDCAFAIFSYGDSDFPAIDLEDITIKSKMFTKWEGLTEYRYLDDGVIEHSRLFSALIPGKMATKKYVENIELQQDNITLVENQVHWEVVPRISVSPSMAVFTQEQQESSILLRAHDKFPFCITEIEFEKNIIQAKVEKPGNSSIIHRIELAKQNKSSLESVKSIIRVITTHPVQKEVEVPVVLLNEGIKELEPTR